ncbi:MAG: acyltransferase [Sphingomicrobium sp.]
MKESLSTDAILKALFRSSSERTPAQNAGTAAPRWRTSIAYRADIDGLRAFAVLIILWFHSGLPGLPGGFIGVDIFFVISGYLITSIVHRDTGEDRFRFAHFYERRFRRIAPALLVVTAATMIASFPLLLANELDELATSAIATVAMVPNIYFWGAVNYFEQSLWARPLLQTWSLGVEEQFMSCSQPRCLLPSVTG